MGGGTGQNGSDPTLDRGLVFRSSGCRFPSLSLVFAAGILCQGCAVGYKWWRPAPAAGLRVGADWSALPFTVDAQYDHVAVVHVLRARHGVIDLSTKPRPDRRFTLTLATRPGSDSSFLTMMPSFLTLSVVPGYYSSGHQLTFSLQAPDGAVFSSNTELTERMVSWFPLGFVGANASYSLGTSQDDTKLDRVAATENLLVRFLLDAEPFVAAHREQPAGSR